MVGVHTGIVVGASAGIVALIGSWAGAAWRRGLALRRHPSADWLRTQGTVLSSTVQVRQQGAARLEVPLVLYAYQVDGQKFQGERIRCTGHRASRDATKRYPAGSRVDVYYDPRDPSVCALER